MSELKHVGKIDYFKVTKKYAEVIADQVGQIIPVESIFVSKKQIRVRTVPYWCLNFVGEPKHIEKLERNGFKIWELHGTKNVSGLPILEIVLTDEVKEK